MTHIQATEVLKELDEKEVEIREILLPTNAYSHLLGDGTIVIDGTVPADLLRKVVEVMERKAPEVIDVPSR